MTDTNSPDDKVLICLNHGAEDPENVLVSYLVGVEALRANKEAVMFLTKDGIHVATPGFAETIDVPNAPSVAALHEEYIAQGGRFFACSGVRSHSQHGERGVGSEHADRRRAVCVRVHDGRRARLQLLN